MKIKALILSFILIVVSNITEFAVFAEEAYQPAGLVAVGGNNCTYISWTNRNSSDVARIDLYEGTSRLASTAVKPISNISVESSDNGRLIKDEGISNNITVTGLLNATQYNYRIRVVTTSGTSSEYEISATPGTEKSIYGWEIETTGGRYFDYKITDKLEVKSNINTRSGAQMKLIPKLTKELTAGTKYNVSFTASAENNSGFSHPLGTEETGSFAEKEYSGEFIYSGSDPSFVIEDGIDKLCIDNFKICKSGGYENLAVNGEFDKYSTDTLPHNLIAAARDKALTVSWFNPTVGTLVKAELLSSDGEVIKSSENDEISLVSGENNLIYIGGLSNGRTYSYTVRLYFSDGLVTEDSCTSNNLADMGQMLWGAPRGSHDIYGWKEAVNGAPYTRFETQSKCVQSGDGALLIRNNTGNGLANTFQQIGPNLKEAMSEGNTYRLTYYRKNVNTKQYSLIYPGGTYTDYNSNDDWKKITIPDFIYDGENDIRFKFERTAEVYIDSVELYLVRDGNITGENLLVNGDFDTIDMQLLKRSDELKNLIDVCEIYGYSTDYEMSQYMILKYFALYFMNDINNSVSESQLEYNINACDEIYERAKKSLTDKLNGVGNDLKVPRYVTSDISIDKSSFLADVELDGEIIEDYPVIFQGWVGMNMLRGDLDDIYDFGFNIIQQEIGPNSIIVPADNEKGWTVDISGAETLLKTLDRAEKLNISVNVLVSPHYFPGFLYDLYPEIKVTQPGFIDFDVTNPVVTEVVTAYLEALIPLIKDSPALHSICLTNEPEFHSVAVKNNPELTKRWGDYLKEQYGDIHRLNAVYGTTYTDFYKIPMPVSSSDASAPKDDASAIYNDYIMFNYLVFGDFHKFLAETIKDSAPEVPLHTKMQNPFFITDYRGVGGSREISYRGNDYEYLNTFLDINGNDSVSNYYTDHWFKDLEKSFFYDMQRSSKDVPVYNSEEHLQWAGNTYFGYEKARQAYNDLWQGAIHGRSASTMWIWDRAYDPASTNYNSMLHRPDMLEAVAKASLDMNRLAKEITKIQQKKPDVALFYSQESRNVNLSFVGTLFKVYESAVMSGQKVGFVTDKSIDNLSDYKVLVMADARSVSDYAAEKIASFAENGGKVLLIGSNNCKYNEHKEIPSGRSAVIRRIEAYADTVSTFVSIDSLKTWFYGAAGDNVKLVDGSTGKALGKTEWQWVYDGYDILISVTNYSWSDYENVKVLINGVEREVSADLITDEYLGETFNLVAHEPRLLRIEGSDEITITNSDNEYTASVNVTNNMPRGEYEPVLIIAVYKADGQLIDVDIDSENVTFGLSSNLSAKVTVPDDGNTYTVKAFLWDGFEKMKPISYKISE